LVKNISLVNTDTSSVTVNVYYLKSGGVQGTDNRCIAPKGLSIPASGQVVLDNEVTLAAGDKIYGIIATGTTLKVDFVASGLLRDV
jgi:hypothetical protein